MFLSLQMLKTIAQPRLRAIRKQMPVTFGLSVLDAKRLKNRVAISIEGPDYTCFKFAENTRTPLYTSAPGKALVAFLPKPSREAIIKALTFKRLTPATLTHARDYRRCLAEVLRRGYATDLGEEIIGCHCGGVPLLDREGHSIGALYLSGTQSKLPPARLLAAIRLLQKTARLIELDIVRFQQGGSKLVHPSPFTQEIIAKLKEHLSQPVHLQTLIDPKRISYSTLRAIFRAETGQSLGQYYLTLRLNEVGRLLRTTRLTLAQISEQMGFCNEKHLSLIFKRHLGLSPRDYRSSTRKS